MSMGDLFWLFFFFTAVQPVLRQRLNDAMRARKIAQIESERNSRVILLVHRQETMRLLGFPLVRYIDINDAEDVVRAIQMTDDDIPIDVILHTPGGLVLAAIQIARAIREHKSKVTVFVPHYAMSGGTLIALAASVYLVLVLEILKFKRLRAWQLRRTDPETSEDEIAASVAHDLETGEFQAVRVPERR